ncbi:MAG: hypothetical protein K6F37_09085 [Lachnospiraceae bacterium]|nr:hypothetical protein [Lachnospiraceae bacterium]
MILLLVVGGCKKPDMDNYLKALETTESTENTDGNSDADNSSDSTETDSTGEVATEDSAEDTENNDPFGISLLDGILPFLDYKEAESTSGDCYEYSMLTDDDRTVYDEILTVINNHEENVAIQTKSPEKLDDVFNRVMADHGEIFWVSGYSYTEYTVDNMVLGMLFTPVYTMSQAKRETIQSQIDSAVEGYLAAIPADADDYTKIKIIYTLLASNVDYDINSENNQTIESVFLNRSTVCQGFANALQYLAHKSGVQAIVVNGTGKSEKHAWNMVNIEGSFYHVDVTWANTTFSGDDGSGESSMINYSYLFMTDEDTAGKYTVESTFDIPPANNTAYTYFIHENKYFDSFDETRLGEVISQAVNTGEESVSLKFASREIYDAAINYLLADFHIEDFCSGMTKAYYYEDTENLILTIRL